MPNRSEDTTTADTGTTRDIKPVGRDTPPPPDVAPVDVPPVDARPALDPCHGPGSGGTAPVGTPCTSHDDCETGYCYDEAWTTEIDGHRFCTIACQGCDLTCSEWTHVTANGNKCIPFRTAGINEHDLVFRSLCLAACANDQECVDAFGGALTTCEMPRDFDGGTIGVWKMCFP